MSTKSQNDRFGSPDTSENTTPAVTKPFIPTSSLDPNTQEVTSHDVRESTPSSSMERQQSDTSENTRSAVTKPFTPTSSLDPNTQEVTSHDVRESTPSSSMERQQSDTSENTRSAVTKPFTPTSSLDPNTQEVTSHDVRESTPSSSMERQQSDTSENTRSAVTKPFTPTSSLDPNTQEVTSHDVGGSTPSSSMGRQQSAICESIESDEDDFLVTSPGSPLNYADDIYCTYHIYAPPKNVVRLTFTSFDVDCDGDLLKIYDGDILGPASTSQHCNNNLPSDMVSTRGEVTLVFTTDSQTNGQGFQANFEYVSKNPCDVTYTDDKSVITSPEYPSPRQTVEQTCVNWIQAPDGKVIEITFTAFSISERRRDDYAMVGFTPAFDWINVGETKTCPYNKITIYDGNDDSHPFETPLCGPSPPPAFKTTGNFMYLSYYSDGTIDDGLYYATFQFLDS
ncbi:putative cubilin [Apostichopus japonicus]|uniref:Putative cubilin n=1 Tax=Stichopus japonicus TaxID=307972 RepID=A0A2G8LN39_STIJA|nr:putative cubilin [Apostichopus japonicus]